MFKTGNEPWNKGIKSGQIISEAGKQKLAELRKIPVRRICRKCGKEFWGGNVARYCSDMCRPKITVSLESRKKIRVRERKQQYSKYGITLGDYGEMLKLQEGRCAICSSKPDKLCVDHNHTTGKVRGLLCHLCNLGLGSFRDDKELLKCGIEYLSNY